MCFAHGSQLLADRASIVLVELLGVGLAVRGPLRLAGGREGWWAEVRASGGFSRGRKEGTSLGSRGCVTVFTLCELCLLPVPLLLTL